ncbi:hypothetical protein GCM10022281_20440 [Sphingomonas rosea]|uniref:Uncharacterized protein n=1 Tax=Sphingomonas rosea TaxID=335605 RepID=A0ABP7UBC7_9SPHN
MMKSEPRPFASLSSGLLARKGAARPAMRPQGFGQMGSNLEDLGWNDMGFEPPRPVLAPVGEGEDILAHRPNPVTGLSPISPVHAVHEEIASRLTHDPVEDELDETAEPVPADVPPLSAVLGAAEMAGPEAAEETVPVAAEPVVSVTMKKPAAKVAPAPVVAVAPAPVIRPAPEPRTRRSTDGRAKAAFTLRLDQERHLKLRLACAVTGTSAQMLVTRALDELLASMPELDAMASQAPERQASRG